MSALLDKIASHADGDRTRRIEVPEWGEPAIFDAKGEITTPAKPLVITYSMVTLDDLSLISELDGQEWNKRSARIVAIKACDEAGARLFATGDALEIRKTAAPEIVNRIAMLMLARTSIEQAEKN